MGGIAAYYQSLLHSSLPERVDLMFVCTSSQKRTLAQSGNFTLSNVISAFEDCVRFTSAVIKHHPQVTHIATAFGLSFVKHSYCVMVARLSGSRVLLHPHCSLSALYTNCSRGWQWYFRRIIRMTDGVIVLSSEWNSLSTIVPGCKVYFLPNAIDLTPFKEVAHERLSRSKPASLFNVLYLGSLGQAKGSFDLVNAAKVIASQNLPIVFNLVGDELTLGELDQLKLQVAQDGLEDVVHLRPSTYGPQKINLFREADLFIYPSYSEGMPMAVIEAMACGLPVIASRVGGLPDLVQDGLNGILIEAGSIDQLVNAIQDLSVNSDLRHSMQINSCQTATDQFDIEKTVTRLVSIYRENLAAG
jgi:glycosyltransferase involved in cell wall biosynthesis